MTPPLAGIRRNSVDALLAAERRRFAARNPRSAALAASSAAHWLQGVPLHWMSDWGLPFPLFFATARGAEIEDVDGHRLADFCLGDSGAMFGHSPPAVVEAVRARAGAGLTTMLPGEDVAAAGELLARTFGLPFWQMTQTASDANRAVLRWARAVTGRPRVLVFEASYHGAVDDCFVALDGDRTVNRPGLVGQATDLSRVAVCVPFNDPDALQEALRARDVACVLAEPVMTNCGMVPPQPGFHEALRQLTRRYGTLLAIDETHCLSSGPGGYTRSAGLEPDFLVVGKAIAGGFPCAVYGFTAELEARIRGVLAVKPAGHSGIGTTLAGNPLALAALCANLRHVMTPAAYELMFAAAARLEAGLTALIDRAGLPWHVGRVGARLEVNFTRRPPRNGREALAARAGPLSDAIRLFLLDRGQLITPFHDMMLLSPETTGPQVDGLVAAWAECMDELLRGCAPGSDVHAV
ncbi:MAG: transaminase [Steroidobacteraceae bacterium]